MWGVLGGREENGDFVPKSKWWRATQQLPETTHSRSKKPVSATYFMFTAPLLRRRLRHHDSHIELGHVINLLQSRSSEVIPAALAGLLPLQIV